MDRTATITDIWVYKEPTWSNIDLSDYRIDAVDGEIGTVDEETYAIGSNALVVKTGPWIFGKKHLLPVGVIDRVDEVEQMIFVNLTKEQIQNAPEFDESRFDDLAHRDEFASYYGRPSGPDYGKSDHGF